MAIIECNGLTAEVRAAVFDKDCTLVDSLAYWPRLAERRIKLLRDLAGLPAEKEPLLYKALGLNHPERTLIPRGPLVLVPRRDTQLAVAAALYLDGLPWDEARDLVREAFVRADDAMEAAGDYPAAFPEAAPLLKKLRAAGILIGVATNDESARTRKALERAGLLDLIDAVSCGDEVAHPKPDPELMLLLCCRLGAEPSQTAVVGDSLPDLRMGRSAGAALAVGVATGGLSREELQAEADAVIASLDEMNVG